MFQFADRSDWRINLLEEKGLTNDVISGILEQLLPNTQNHEVTVLEPGLSGFQVLLVTYTYVDNDSPCGIVLKIAKATNSADQESVKSQEDDARQIIEQWRQNNQEYGNSYIPVTNNKVVDGWLCLISRHAARKQTFKRYLLEYIKQGDFELDHANKIIEDAVNLYWSGPWNRSVQRSNIWSPQIEGIIPLSQREYLTDYLQNIHRVIDDPSNDGLIKAIGIDSFRIKDLLTFIETGKYCNAPIDPTTEDIPLSSIHGDLNGGNILVDQKTGANPVVIDLGQMSASIDRHTFFDLGKLSIDFERYVLPGEIFHNDLTDTLCTWVAIHQQWLFDEDIRQFQTHNSEWLFRLYSMLSHFRKKAIDKCQAAFGDQFTDRATLAKHFQFVRLHYMLRVINHCDLDSIRKLFAIRAALDILDYLTQKTPRSLGSSSSRNLPVTFDCTKDDFVNHLAQCECATIVGVTNESLVSHLKEARSKRNEPWENIKIVSLAENMLQAFYRHHAGDMPPSQMLNGMRDLSQYLLNDETNVTKNWDIRQSRGMLPFVGQIYDESNLRVAFILPERDIRESCYLNLSTETSPCADARLVGIRASSTDEAHSVHNNRRCRDARGASRPCNECSWEGREHSACMAIQREFVRLLAHTTPAYTANVVGVIDKQPLSDTQEPHREFLFRHLVPEHRWRDYQMILNKTFHEKPAHLLAFVLLRNKDNVFLQLRTPENCGGEYNLFGAIPGKVNDVDFFDQVDMHLMEDVYDLQKRWPQLQESKKQLPLDILNKMIDLAKSFREKHNISPQGQISQDKLTEAFRRAAARTLREKLGVDLTGDILSDNRVYVVERENHELFIQVLIQELEDDEAMRITSLPYANITPKTLIELKDLQAKNQLTEFLDQNIDAVTDMLFEQSTGR